MSLSSELRQSLSQSSKGQLKYDRHWWQERRFNGLLDDPSRNSHYVSLPLLCAGPNFIPVVEVKDRPQMTEKSSSLPKPEKPLSDSLISKITQQGKETETQLRDYELIRRQQVQDAFNKKRDEFNKHSIDLYRKSQQRMQTLFGRKKLEEDQKAKDLEAKHEMSINEGKRRHQLLIEHNLSLAKQSDERFQQAALKDKLEQEAVQRRILEMQQHMESFGRSRQCIHESFEKTVEILRSCGDNQLLSNETRDAVNEINKIVNTVGNLIQQLKGRDIEQKDVLIIDSLKAKATSHLDTIIRGVELANQKANESTDTAVESLNVPLADIQNTPELSKGTVDEEGSKTNSNLGTNCIAGLQKYAQYMSLLEKTRNECQDLINNPMNKKCRTNLQKAVNTPVNAISVHSGSQLLDQLDKLHRLISGQPVEVSERLISITDHPKGKIFCLDLLAKKFVNQGEEVVSSSPVAAFPIAVVIVGLWKDHPAFGELLLGHFFEKCVFLVPYHPTPQIELSEQDYYRALGYNISDGVLEEKDKFLKRMSGVMRLYAAILQSGIPRGSALPHPHGVEHGWAWFSGILNIEPIPDVTASLLFEFLDVCGYTLLRHYGRQFQKLLRLLWQDYFPKIKKVTPVGSGGPLIRLEEFLQKCAKQGNVPPPEGLLSNDFWYS